MGALHRSNFERRHFHPALERAGLRKIRFHDLRYTRAALRLLAGELPSVIRGLLGHVSIRTTLDVHGHLAPSRWKAAASRYDKLMNLTRRCAEGHRESVSKCSMVTMMIEAEAEMEASQAPLAREIAFYERQKDELLKTHAGKFVVISGERIIGIFDTAQSAYEMGVAEVGTAPLLLRQITPESPVVSAPALYTGLVSLG